MDLCCTCVIPHSFCIICVIIHVYPCFHSPTHSLKQTTHANNTINNVLNDYVNHNDLYDCNDHENKNDHDKKDHVNMNDHDDYDDNNHEIYYENDNDVSYNSVHINTQSTQHKSFSFHLKTYDYSEQ